jgi:hypothetical protein
VSVKNDLEEGRILKTRELYLSSDMRWKRMLNDGGEGS